MQRMTWDEICQRDDFKGRWLALDGCRYDQATGLAAEGLVVDTDNDLVELCSRIQRSDRKNCAIVFCSHDMQENSLPRIVPCSSP